MKNFSYIRARSQREAIGAATQSAAAYFLAGGTNLVDLMRENIEQPDAVIDLTRLPLDSITELPDGGLQIGALVSNSQLAADSKVRERYPLLSEAILNGASGQIRNMATTAGNVMQRTRCYYFYDKTANCNKRTPGAGCDALHGVNRNHAILGTSAHCIATHPSDMCVALAALAARVQVSGPGGDRTIPFEEFHRLPGETPERETNLAPGEMITSIELPALPFARHSAYRKARDRASYAFALVSVAAALEVRDHKISNVRLALGGVAHKPWRAHAAEEILRDGVADRATFLRAARAELAAATPSKANAFKVTLAQNMIVAVLSNLAGLEVGS